MILNQGQQWGGRHSVPGGRYKEGVENDNETHNFIQPEFIATRACNQGSFID